MPIEIINRQVDRVSGRLNRDGVGVRAAKPKPTSLTATPSTWKTLTTPPRERGSRVMTSPLLCTAAITTASGVVLYVAHLRVTTPLQT